VLQSHGFSLEVDTIAQLFRVISETSTAPPPPARSAASQSSSGLQLFVISLQHARAGDVASTVNALYGRGGGPMADVARTATLSEELRGNLVPPEGPPNVGTGAVTPRRSGQLSGELVIVADPRANSLLVRATAADLELIQGVVTALDVRPLQVMIEVLIAEVRRDRSVGVNVEAELSPTDVGRSGAQLEGALGEAGLGDFALRVMGVGGLDLATTLRLASGRGNVRILTRPVVLATNNQSAEIVVGSQRPFVQVSRALPTDGATRDQVVQYKDVGTKLVVTPTISQDGSVQLEVTQEVSTATSELAFNAPVIATRSVRTQLLVRDGQTVALGGLTDRQREARQGGLPILSSIPLLGGLFGRASRQSIETELFLFLTPHVVRTDEDAAAQTAPMSERVVPPES
jgi:general secretion pathway protein D